MIDCLSNKYIYAPEQVMQFSLRSESKQEGFGVEPAYQINTGKVIKGHKLTMKDLLQKQKIKSKHGSPTNKHKQFQQTNTFTPRITDFSEKYKGLQTLDDEQSLYRFIAYQRQKQSRGSARGIKLFTCQKKGETIDDDSYVNNHISFTPRNTKTSQSNRRDPSSAAKSNNKTISYENPIQSSLQNGESQIAFLSDNLGKRMNQYLNIILQKKEKAELIIKQDEIKQEAQLYKLKHDLINQVRVVNRHARLKSNNFYRQMKKSKKTRILSAQTMVSQSVRQNQLVKTLMRKTTNQFNQKRTNSNYKELNKSFSATVKDRQKPSQKTTRSFYSKHSDKQKQSSLGDFDNILTLIYRK